MGVSENVGYIPNEIAIFHRDNDQQNHWVFWGTNNFQTHPYWKIIPDHSGAPELAVFFLGDWVVMWGPEIVVETVIFPTKRERESVSCVS